jgi:hypothetical protein
VRKSTIWMMATGRWDAIWNSAAIGACSLNVASPKASSQVAKF